MQWKNMGGVLIVFRALYLLRAICPYPKPTPEIRNNIEFLNLHPAVVSNIDVIAKRQWKPAGSSRIRTEYYHEYLFNSHSTVTITAWLQLLTGGTWSNFIVSLNFEQKTRLEWNNISKHIRTSKRIFFNAIYEHVRTSNIGCKVY